MRIRVMIKENHAGAVEGVSPALLCSDKYLGGHESRFFLLNLLTVRYIPDVQE